MSPAVEINADMSARAVMRADEMDWQPSPSGSVWRKRFHLVGGAESGQVTSLVRYERRSRFPAHDHPGGEEILVLDGVFSDEHGDWPEGTYLLNPEGFRHAPYSEPGCLLFVKLRQYAGGGRRHLALRTGELPWSPTPVAGVAAKTLYSVPEFADRMRLERWQPGAAPGETAYPGGAEILVLKGELEDEQDRYGALTWLRLPPGGSHAPASAGGCTLYVKCGGVAGLRSGADG